MHPNWKQDRTNTHTHPTHIYTHPTIIWVDSATDDRRSDTRGSPPLAHQVLHPISHTHASAISVNSREVMPYTLLPMELGHSHMM